VAIKTAWWRLIPVILVALIPASVTITLIHSLYGVTIFAFRPSANDETAYWHQTLTFYRAGFHGGYYTFNEAPAAANMFHFGPHGPWFPALQGSLWHIVGAHPYSTVLLDLILVTVAVGWFAYTLRHNRSPIILLGALLACFWPLLIWLQTNLQEATHCIIAIIIARLMIPLIARDAALPWRRVALIALLLVASALIRPTWALLLIPLGLLATERCQLWQKGVAMIVALVLIAIIGQVFFLTSAPIYHAGTIAAMDRAAQSPYGSLQLTVERLGHNVEAMTKAPNPNYLGFWLQEVQQFGVVAGLAFGCVVLCAAVVRRKSAPAWMSAPGMFRLAVFSVGNLGLVAVAQVLFNLLGDWRDYRVTSAHLLLSALLSIAHPLARPLAAALIVAHLGSVGVFLTVYREFSRDHFVHDYSEIQSFRDTIATALRYDADASPWCNTLLTSIYPAVLTEVPAGLGLSYWTMPLASPRSKYLLVLPADEERLVSALPTRLLAQSPVGILYENLGASC
jgi:hypothetical protein